MNNTIIETSQLCKSFGPTRAIVDVNLTLPAGLPIGLVGPNGAGKTTLFSMLCGFLKPTSGSIKILGEEPLHHDLRSQVAILPQDAALKHGISIIKQMAFFAALQGFGRSESKRIANEVLEHVGLLEKANATPDGLSHGMKKRVAIAQCLIGTPKIILLDEPTAGLDAIATRKIHNIIHERKKDCTFVISSHDLNEIQDLCASVLILKKGKINTYDDMSTVVGDGDCLNFRFATAPSPNQIEQLLSLPGVTNVKRGEEGKQRLFVFYESKHKDNIEITLLTEFKKLGLQFTEMSRGEALVDKVIQLTK